MSKIKYLLITVTTALILVSTQLSIKAEPSSNAIELRQLAQTLTRSGREQLDRGNAASALQTWSEATKIYTRLHYQEGIVGSLINQSLAFKAEGQYYRACDVLMEALQPNFGSCTLALMLTNQPANSLSQAIAKIEALPVNAIGLQNLGDVLRGLGKLEEAKQALAKALILAKQLNLPILSEIFLGLGNVEESFFIQSRDRYNDIGNPVVRNEAASFIQQKALLSLDFYQQAQGQKLKNERVSLISQLHQLKLLLDVNDWLTKVIESGESELATFHKSIYAQIQPLVERLQLNSVKFDELPASEAILAELSFANSLSQMGDNSVAVQFALSALQKAKTLDNPRLKSSSLGILGKLQPQIKQSEANLESALRLAQEVQAVDLAWQWESNLGQRYQKQGKYQQAIQAYTSAINHLNQVRGNLAANPEIQFSFRDEVEPIYRQLVNLLLHAQNNSQPPQSNLVQARSTIESLQLAELDNFLRTACLQEQSVLLDRVVDRDDLHAAVIYPIILADRLAIILKLPNQPLRYYETAVAQSEIEELLAELRQKLTKTYTLQEVQSLSRQVYNWLIRPAEQDLAKNQIKTLVFVLDGALRNIPMATLYDGQQYLIEKYAVALSPGLQLLPPKSIDQAHLRVLTAGLTEAHQGFSALNNVELELEQIKASVSSTELLNQKFTSAKLEKEINSVFFPVVHLATHGQFSSQAERTFILAWDKPILVNELNSLLQARDQSNPIDLLVLSACETATGDKRATLGLAGVAIRAGARSTLASLWFLDDRSSALLIGQFYQGLTAKQTKADAIRNAQLALLQNPQFAHPNYWANFVLIGSWL